MTPISKDPIIPPRPPVSQPEKPPETQTKFDAHLQTTESQPGQQAASNPQPQGIDPAQTGPSGKVNISGADIPKQDFMQQFDHVKKDFQAFLKKSEDLDSLVAEGKLKPDDPKVKRARQEEMRTLLHFQIEMQSASMRVEIASKVVEQATSGVNKALSTQA